MIYFVNICNILAALWILVVWIRESRSLPRKFVRHMSLRYACFFLVFALMMNRFNRYSLWEASVSGTTPVPHWPLTRAEMGIIYIYLVLWAFNLVIYYVNRFMDKESDDENIYLPFSLITVFYPVMLPGLKLAKGKKRRSFYHVFQASSGCLGF